MAMDDFDLLRTSIEAAYQARKNGNHPFGAVLVDASNTVLLEAQNTVVTSRDATAHAELNLVRTASTRYSPDFLASCTLYASTEPCPMCAGAIFWAGIGRVVYGLSAESLYSLIGDNPTEALHLPCREVFVRGGRPVDVSGPNLESEALQMHLGFWGPVK